MPDRAPLGGLVVVDLTHVLAGPLATMLLADLGAMVIKIEKPGRGDTTRATPPLAQDFSSYFAALNRNKYSVGLDIKTEAGRSVLLQLVEQADVLVHSMRPGVMEKLGLGYDDLATRFPRLIYAAVSGFGSQGSYAQRPAFDAIVQAMAGIMSLTGEAGGPALRAGISVGDLGAGLFATIGVLAAVAQRHLTGAGQRVEVSMFDALFNLLSYYVPYSDVTGRAPQRFGDQHPTVVPMGAIEVVDGAIALAAFNQNFWRNLCRALEHEEWITDPRFRRGADRATHRDELVALMSEIMHDETIAHWAQRFTDFDVPFAPIMSIPELLADDFVAERRLLETVQLGNPPAPAAVSMRVPTRPVQLSDHDYQLRRNPPRLGEDTAAVLCELLSMTETSLAELARDGAIELPGDDNG